MKLISNGNIALGFFGEIKNAAGTIVAPAALFQEPKGTEIDITVLGTDVFKVTTPNINHIFELGEELCIVREDFDMKVIVSEVGNDRFRVAPLYEDLAIDYSTPDVDVIPSDATKVYRTQDIIRPISLSDGKYYTEYGELLYVGNVFNNLLNINYLNIYAMKPNLRGKAIRPWQLNNIVKKAYDLVMEKLAGFEEFEEERFKYINIGGLTTLIEYKAMALYEKSYPSEKGFIYTNSFKSALNGFQPYLKIDEDGVVTKSKRKRLRN